MSNFVQLSYLIPNLVAGTSDENNPKIEELIKFLQKKDYIPLDLFRLDEFKKEFEGSLESFLDVIASDLLDLIGTGKFAKDLDRVIDITKDSKDLKTLKCIKYFLEHEDQDEYNLGWTADLISMLPKIKNAELQTICIYLIGKIDSLIIKE